MASACDKDEYWKNQLKQYLPEFCRNIKVMELIPYLNLSSYDKEEVIRTSERHGQHAAHNLYDACVRKRKCRTLVRALHLCEGYESLAEEIDPQGKCKPSGQQNNEAPHGQISTPKLVREVSTACQTVPVQSQVSVNGCIVNLHIGETQPASREADEPLEYSMVPESESSLTVQSGRNDAASLLQRPANECPPYSQRQRPISENPQSLSLHQRPANGQPFLNHRPAIEGHKPVGIVAGEPCTGSRINNSADSDSLVLSYQVTGMNMKSVHSQVSDQETTEVKQLYPHNLPTMEVHNSIPSDPKVMATPQSAPEGLHSDQHGSSMGDQVKTYNLSLTHGQNAATNSVSVGQCTRLLAEVQHGAPSMGALGQNSANRSVTQESQLPSTRSELINLKGDNIGSQVPSDCAVVDDISLSMSRGDDGEGLPATSSTSSGVVETSPEEMQDIASIALRTSGGPIPTTVWDYQSLEDDDVECDAAPTDGITAVPSTGGTTIVEQPGGAYSVAEQTTQSLPSLAPPPVPGPVRRTHSVPTHLPLDPNRMDNCPNIIGVPRSERVVEPGTAGKLALAFGLVLGVFFVYKKVRDT